MGAQTLGVLAVEDGSVDIDNLEEEGLAPGKILVYRQGSTPPDFLGGEKLPVDFDKEEENLLDEFHKISGTSEMGNMETISNSISGVALELLIDENETRLIFTTDSIKTAIKTVAKHILRLYKQFATLPRLLKVMGENGGLDIMYFSQSDITSDDVRFDTDNDSTDTVSQRREMIFNLLDKGLLSDENGKISNATRSKILENLGFGVWENATDLNELHLKNADLENTWLASGENVSVKEIDEHALHVASHVGYMLKNIYGSKNVDKNVEAKFLQHIAAHKSAVEQN